MVETRPRTPGILMTEAQFFDVLDELCVLHVARPEGGKVTLVLKREGQTETLTATDIKGRATAVLAELEERRKEIEENQFAEPLEGAIATAGQHMMRVRYAKRNDQLTPEEVEEKQNLMRGVVAAMARERLIVGAMNYLQVHYRELQPRLRQRSVPPAAAETGSGGVRQHWTKGIKLAALHCIREGERPENAGRPGLEICRDFLVRYSLEEDDEGYTAEQLYRNVQQVLLLDRSME